MASSLHPQQISVRTEKWIRFSAIAVMFIVAIASMVLSFDGLRKLATEAKISDQLAFLFPVIVDGTIIMASLAILRMNLSGQRAVLGWITMFLGTGLSIAGNVISVRNEGVIAMGTHALPPILLATSLELFLSLIRTNIKLAQDAKDSAVKISKAAQSQPTPAIVYSEPVQQFLANEADLETPAIQETPADGSPKDSANLPLVPTENKKEESRDKVAEEPTNIFPNPVISPALPEKNEYAEEVNPAIDDAELDIAEEESTEIPVPKIVFETVIESTPPVDSVKVLEEEPSSSPDPLPAVKAVDDSSVDNIDDKMSEDALYEPETVRDTAENAEEPVQVIDAPIEPVKKPAVSKAKPDNENVVNYKKILEKLKPETKKHIKIAAILSKFPDAKPVDIKKAIGDPANARYTEPMQQAKAFLVQRAQQKQNRSI